MMMMKMNVEQSVEWRLAAETEVLGENLPQCNSVHHKSHMTCPGLVSGKPATNRLSYGTAYFGFSPRSLHNLSVICSEGNLGREN
jgi:hypothetical protein